MFLIASIYFYPVLYFLGCESDCKKSENKIITKIIGYLVNNSF